MKFTRNLPKTDKILSRNLQEKGWVKIKEPRNLFETTLLSLPLSFILMAITTYLTHILKPEMFEFLTSNSFKIVIQISWHSLLLLIAILAYMFIHEMIHAILIPNFIKSEKTMWGINGFFGFVFTTEPIEKPRFLLISCMPFILLSIIMLFVFDILGHLNGYTFTLCLINAGGSCVDFLNMILIGMQAKKGSTIINNGFETYYTLGKKASNS